MCTKNNDVPTYKSEGKEEPQKVRFMNGNVYKVMDVNGPLYQAFFNE